jgi:hydrogenase-4 component F
MNILVTALIAAPALFSVSYFSSHFRSFGIVAGVIAVSLSAAVYLFQISAEGIYLIDPLTRYLLITISSIYLFSIVFGLGYHHKMGESANLKLHLSLMDIFASTMLFSVSINNYGLLWFGIESTTVSSALLLVIEREPLKIEAAWRYIILVSAGLTISLISVIVMYYAFHTLTISQILVNHGSIGILTDIAAGSALIGYGTKIGLFPMHTWLPDAHSEAPSEISAMFSGVLLPVAVYALYRVYQVTADPRVTDLFLFVAVLTVLFAAFMLPSQRFYKRMFAYSTMENMGVIVIGFIIGGPAIIGAIILLVSHAFGKSGAFYSSGNILETFGTKKISEISSLRSKMPQTSASLILSSLAVTGTPPFGTFLGEFIILLTLYSDGYILPFSLIVVALFVSFASVNYHVSRMVFYGKDSERSEVSVQQRVIAVLSSVIPLLIPAFFFVFGGFSL